MAAPSRALALLLCVLAARRARAGPLKGGTAYMPDAKPPPPPPPMGDHMPEDTWLPPVPPPPMGDHMPDDYKPPPSKQPMPMGDHMPDDWTPPAGQAHMPGDDGVKSKSNLKVRQAHRGRGGGDSNFKAGDIRIAGRNSYDDEDVDRAEEAEMPGKDDFVAPPPPPPPPPVLKDEFMLLEGCRLVNFHRVEPKISNKDGECSATLEICPGGQRQENPAGRRVEAEIPGG
eukprot:SAG22_NODE_706_length_7763_cov_4.404228_13_plen_229_part_00